MTAFPVFLKGNDRLLELYMPFSEGNLEWRHPLGNFNPVIVSN